MSLVNPRATAKTAGNSAALKRGRSTLAKLLAFDEKLRVANQSVIVGVDEVGRGCLAGPVMAAAVCLPAVQRNTRLARSLYELNDSKQLNAGQRERLSLIIKEHALWAIESASVEEIDRLNIVRASLTAMRRAVHRLLESLPVNNNLLVIVDGHLKIPELDHSQMVVVKGDGLSASIAAASVIAKVQRDGFMSNLADSLPVYGWQRNKGYGSKTHRQAIVDHGVTSWHRKAFIARMMADLNQLKIEL